MANHTGENVFRVSAPFLILLMAILITAVTETTRAKSLYVIADIEKDPTPVQAYNIEADGTLTFQIEHSIPRYGWGAVGLAIDSDSEYLFVTYEASNLIQLINARTMTGAGITIAPDANNLAGIVYDHSKELLYCVDRKTKNLYVYDWDPNTTTLTHVPGSPFTLPGTWVYAYGIALDEVNGLLYVANHSYKINVYNTYDWSLERIISLSRISISVAVDTTNGLLYAGGTYGYEDNNYLIQYNLATDTEVELYLGPEACAMGLAVDPHTSLLYMGTGRNNKPGGDDLLVYDKSFNQIDAVLDIGNPTGIIIPGKDISYNPLNLSKIVRGIDETPAGNFVGAGDTITYEICFDNNDNDYTVNNVSIVDTLPDEVSFVTADGDGVFGHYDAITHTYTWSYPSLEPQFGTCLELEVQVNQDTAPGSTITNSATISSNQTLPTTVSVDVFTEDISYNPLNLSKIARGIDGTPTGNFVGAGDTITYEICFDNNDNDYPVNNVSIVDTLPDEVSFVTADGNGVFGHYDAITHTYTWSYPSLEPQFGTCLELEVQVNQGTAPGTTITNSATISSDETSPTTASVDVVVKEISYNPLNVSKNIIRAIIDQNAVSEVECVGVGDTIIYGICFNNNDNDYTVTDVSIVDTLPDEVSFVTADGNGVFGQYDAITHTYTWSYPYLGPLLGTCLELEVQVNQDTALNTTITNSVTISSEQTMPTTASVDVVVKEISYNPLNVSKTVVSGVDETPTGNFVGAGDTITYEICFDNNDNDYTVNNVSIVDTLPDEVSFVTADGDGVFGHYDAITHTYTWSYPSLEPQFGTCLELEVQVNQGTAPSTTITNSATISSNETSPTTASVDVVVKEISYNPLNLSKNIIRAIIDQNAVSEVECVGVGDTIIYGTCFNNNDNDYTVTDVSIVDTLPDEVSFVTADGDGIFGHYDAITHTYTWSYPSLEPQFGTCLELEVQVNQGTAPSTTITNSVTINSDETAPTTASVDVITCESPLEADLCIIPSTIRRNGCSESILAVVELPQGVGKSDVKNELLTLNPGSIEAKKQLILGTDDRAKVLALFDKADLMDAVPGYGPVELEVVGKLESGQSFYGKETIQITKFTGS